MHSKQLINELTWKIIKLLSIRYSSVIKSRNLQQNLASIKINTDFRHDMMWNEKFYLLFREPLKFVLAKTRVGSSSIDCAYNQGAFVSHGNHLSRCKLLVCNVRYQLRLFYHSNCLGNDDWRTALESSLMLRGNRLRRSSK